MSINFDMDEDSDDDFSEQMRLFEKQQRKDVRAPLEEPASSDEKDILKNLKISQIDSVDKQDYPVLKMMVRSDTGKKTEITGTYMFGISSINNSPMFTYNLPLTKKILEYLKDVKDETLLKLILALNSKTKEKNVITDISKIEELKTYMKTFHYFSNKLYDFYLENLRRLIFFSRALFEEIILIYMKKEKKTIVDSVTYDDMMKINNITKGNIELLKEILLENFKNNRIILTKSKQKEFKDNLYQSSNAIISIADISSNDSDSSYEKYKTDYSQILSIFNSKYSSKTDKETTGNFYSIMKYSKKYSEGLFGSRSKERTKDLVLGNFNSYSNFEILDVTEVSTSSKFIKVNCKTRTSKIGYYYKALKGSKGGSKKHKKKRSKRRKTRCKRYFYR